MPLFLDFLAIFAQNTTLAHDLWGDLFLIWSCYHALFSFIEVKLIVLTVCKILENTVDSLETKYTGSKPKQKAHDLAFFGT